MKGILLASDPSAEVFHQFARLQSMTQWWHWLTLTAVCLLIVVYVAILYRRDAFEMATAKRWALIALRVAAFAGILIFFLDLERRERREVVKNSRAILLVDTSLSMGMQDDPVASSASAAGTRRIDGVVQELERGDLIAQMRRDHDVVVYRFDESATPAEVASLAKRLPASEAGKAGDLAAEFAGAVSETRLLVTIAGVVLGVALISLLWHLAVGQRRRDRDGSWSLLVGMVGLLAAVVVFSVAHLRHPEIDWAVTLGLRPPQPPSADPSTGAEAAAEAAQLATQDVSWDQQLAPRGSETRLGDAIRYLVQRERDGSLAGIVVITDGGNNAGVDADQAVAAARAAGIPVYAIGLGGDERPANVRIVDIEAPLRVYPGDGFALNGYVQAFGLAGRTVKVELRSTDALADPAEALEEFEDERSVPLGDDGVPVPIRFEVIPREQGMRQYELRVVAPEQDHDPRDNQRTAKVQIVDRKNRVLLMAGGPTRDYRFLRDLLYRDRDTILDVFLQTGQAGSSQESDRLLTDFPTTPEELFEYDCVVAFDPDWMALAEDQVDLLERWVSDEAGGLVVVAGPVHTPKWVSRLRSETQISKIKSLYPVIFYSRGSATLSLGRFASETAWPLQFTPDGRDAEFLWLEDDPVLSRQAWDSFEGVYGYYAVKDPKPGARVYCHFSDPSTAIDGDLPIYLAGHFYGAGRVMFQASGEMWRVRGVDNSYFERYYTKLIRWVSQGRLSRDSSRGVLLVDKSRCLLGDHVVVRAILTDAQHNPLTAEQVNAVLIQPDGRRSSLSLNRVQDPGGKGGMFAAQFTATLEGDYRVELQPPHGDENELLVREVRSRIPALETERPERNDPLLRNLAEQTGGRYFVGLDAAMNRKSSGAAPMYHLLEPQDQVSYVAGTPDKEYERMLMTWLMGIICGALCLEWLIRRLSKLA